jgi:hypothetical protein
MRALRAGRRQLHHPEVLTGDVVDIQPTPQRLGEALGPIGVGDGHHHNLGFQVHDLSLLRLLLSQPLWPVVCAHVASKPRDGRRGNGQSEFSSSPQLMTEESPPSPRRLAPRIQPAQLRRQAMGVDDLVSQPCPGKSRCPIQQNSLRVAYQAK